MRIVQFTDTHLVSDSGEKFLGVDTFLTLSLATEIAMSLTPLPKVMIVTGDIAERGDSATYSRFREIFEPLSVPVYVVPGNHDDDLVMKNIFHGSNIKSTDHVVINDHLFIFVDSHVKAKPHGFLSAETLANVENLLKTHADKPVVISMHHPVSSPCPALGCQLQNESELLQALKHTHQVVTLLSGHLHKAIDESMGSIRLLTTPSTFAQCEHPEDGQYANLNSFWETHKMDTTRRGFRTLDFQDSSLFKTEIHWF